MFIIVLLHMGLAWFEPPSIKDRGADKFQDRLPILTGVEVLFLTAYIIESAYDLIDLGWFWFRHAPMKIVRSTIILIMVSDLVMFSIFDGVSSDVSAALIVAQAGHVLTADAPGSSLGSHAPFARSCCCFATERCADCSSWLFD